MARQEGTWAEYSTADVSSPVIERVFSSETKALRSAVDNGNKVTRLGFGETIQDALTKGRGPKPKTSVVEEVKA